MLLVGLFQSRLGPDGTALAWCVAIGICAVWTAFAWWRGYRLFKAFTLRRDRQFDRRDKFALGSDYSRSESATKARQRRKSAPPKAR